MILLISWAVISSYLKLWVIVCVFFVTFINFLSVQTFIFHWKHENKVISAKKSQIPEKNIETEISSCFRTAVLTSWISPYTVWFNTLTKVENKFEKYSLAVSNIACLTSVCIIIGTLYIHSIFYKNHCVETVNISHFNDTVPPCSQEEMPTDWFFHILGPLKIGFLITSFFLSSLPLQYIGNYHYKFKISRFIARILCFKMKTKKISFQPVPHYSQFFDILSVFKNVKPWRRDDKLKKLLQKASTEVINYQNPFTGNTWLHTAIEMDKFERPDFEGPMNEYEDPEFERHHFEWPEFERHQFERPKFEWHQFERQQFERPKFKRHQFETHSKNCEFELVKQLIEKGGDPFLLNKAHESIDSLIKLCSFEEFLNRAKKKLEILKKRITTITNELVLFEIFLNKEESDQIVGFAVVSKNGKEKITHKLENGEEVFIAFCLLRKTLHFSIDDWDYWLDRKLKPKLSKVPSVCEIKRLIKQKHDNLGIDEKDRDKHLFSVWQEPIMHSLSLKKIGPSFSFSITLLDVILSQEIVTNSLHHSAFLVKQIQQPTTGLRRNATLHCSKILML